MNDFGWRDIWERGALAFALCWLALGAALFFIIGLGKRENSAGGRTAANHRDAPLPLQLPLESSGETRGDPRSRLHAVRNSVVTLIIERGSERDAIGSGFAVGRGDLIATNYHVVRGALRVVAILADGQEIDLAGWRAVSAEHDVAVLQLPMRHQLPPLSLATKLPAELTVVYAWGSPRGLTGTVSDGVVSAIRQGLLPNHSNETIWIQTDAAISPGSSGGPLVDQRGQVVGINTVTLSDSQGLNFAVAINHLADLLKKGGELKPFYALPTARLTPSRRDYDLSHAVEFACPSGERLSCLRTQCTYKVNLRRLWRTSTSRRR